MNWGEAEPVDPVYVAFRDGILRADDDVTDALRWRWSPRHRGWFTYPTAKWILDDVQVADTPAGYSFDLIKGDDLEGEKARARMWVPPLFRAVQAAYARHSASKPGLVWTWRGGGDWRDAIQRPPQPAPVPDPDPDPPPNGDPYASLNAECKRRIDEVRAWAARGDVTSVQAQRMIAKIVEECTLGPD